MSMCYRYHIQRFLLEWLHRARAYSIILQVQMCVRVREWKIQNEREMVMTIKCAWSGVENEAGGVKESRVSRVTIRFGTAVVSAGSWALSICNSLYGVRDVCTWLYCIGHGNATRTISNYTLVEKKCGARESPELSKRWRVLYPLSPPLHIDPPPTSPFAGSRWKFKHLIPRLFAGWMIFPRVAENGIFI